MEAEESRRKGQRFTRRWQKTRKRWITENPPDEYGNYVCVYCLCLVNIERLSLDHILRVADFPQFAFTLSNLQPMHNKCNSRRDRLMMDPRFLKRRYYRKDHDDTNDRRMIEQAIEQYRRYDFAKKIPK